MAISLLGLLYPLTTGHHPMSVAVLLVGLLAELTGALTGMAVGLLCSRLVIRRTGWSVVTGLLATFVLLLVPGMPPMNRRLPPDGDENHAGAVLPGVLGFAVLSLASRSRERGGHPVRRAAEGLTAMTGHWWRDAVIYQVYVRSFADGNGDGVGDLPGVRSQAALPGRTSAWTRSG